jgi:hypothetical protein
MANVKISALPSTTASTLNDYLIKNDSGETTTSKVQLKDVLGMTNPNGNDSIQSSSWLTSLGTTGSTTGAVAIGAGAEATSPYSVAIGYRAYNVNRDGSRDGYISIGYEANAVQYSIALGYSPDALGADTIALGTNAGSYGNGGTSIGKQAFQASNNGVALGAEAEDYANQAGVAIGFDSYVSHDGAVALGSGVTSVYSSTTHVNNIHITGQASNTVQNLGSGDTFNINWQAGQSVEMVLTDDSTCSMTNLRDGARYRVKITTTGTQTLTPSASGYTFIYEGGGFTLTTSGTDLCVLDVFGTTVMVSHFSNFS